MNARRRARIRPLSRGGFEINLPPDERALLRVLPGQLAASLGALGSTAEPPTELRRILPVAHPRDAEAQADYAERIGPQILAHHLDALDVLAKTADARRIDETQLEAWLHALNDLRLALGTALGVSEEQHEPDPDAPDYADWVCYHYLSFLQTEIVDVLEGLLPPPEPGAGADLPEDPWGEPLGGLRWDGTPVPEDGT